MDKSLSSEELKAKALELANEDGKKFISAWCNNIIGIEMPVGGQCKSWFYVLEKGENGKTYCSAISAKDSGCESSGYGDLEYFSMVRAFYIADIKIRWTPSGYPLYPWCDVYNIPETKYRKWEEAHKSIMKKYSSDNR